MKICIVGGGAREVAVARTIKRSPRCSSLITIANHQNPALKEISAAYKVAPVDDVQAVVSFCQAEKADLVFIGPEAPLAAGVVDGLEAVGIKVVGPTKALAQVESSKSFARDLMTQHEIPGCPKYKIFTSKDGMSDFINTLGGDYVIKADGLLGGKGVKVSGDHLKSVDEALVFADTLFAKGQKVLVEEKLIGQEFTLMSFSDGTCLAHLPPIQDYKRAYPGDNGPNTGGMGSYSCSNHLLPFLTPNDVEMARDINERMAAALLAFSRTPAGGGDGRGFRGVLYGKYVCAHRGVGCVDFNARFGDPEALNVMAAMRSDMVRVLEAVVGGTLKRGMVEVAPLSTVVKYAVPFGYPDKPVKGQVVEVEEALSSHVFLGSVDVGDDGSLLETGSRTAACIGTGATLEQAQRDCETEIRKIKGLLYHRADIATESLIAKSITAQREVRRVRVGVVGSTRGSSLQPILYAIHDGYLNARIEVVVSNIATADILERAKVHGIPAVHIPGKGRVREEFDRDVTAALKAKKVDLVLLIGFMRIVSGEFCREWAGRMLNVHPSLLPKHGGLMDLDVHNAVLAAGDKETGCTVHQVAEEVDGGAIVLQLKVPVHSDDTARTLKAKVQELEGKALIAAVDMYDQMDGCLPV